MNLPININVLIAARTVEWERLELKVSSNPKTVLHTLFCLGDTVTVGLVNL